MASIPQFISKGQGRGKMRSKKAALQAAAARRLTGRENAATRGRGQKKGLVKQGFQVDTQRSPDVETRQASGQSKGEALRGVIADRMRASKKPEFKRPTPGR